MATDDLTLAEWGLLLALCEREIPAAELGRDDRLTVESLQERGHVVRRVNRWAITIKGLDAC